MQNITIDYYDFLNKIIIVHSDADISFDDRRKILIENNYDAITYKYTNKILLFNCDVLQNDDNGNFYYEYTFKRYCDVISNIIFTSLRQFNFKLNYYIGNTKFQPEEINEFLFVCALYNDLTIRITFLEIPNINDEFIVSSTNYLFRDKLRIKLVNNNIYTKYIMYSGGLCKRININEDLIS